MSLVLEKAALKKEIDRIKDSKVLDAIKTILTYSNESNDVWEDEEFIAKLDKRSAELKSGKTKTYTLEEVESAARKSRKKKQR